MSRLNTMQGGTQVSDLERQTDHPISAAIQKRWSPYVFADRDVSKEDLLSLFEAARWAASSYNEQPWRYIVATRDDREGFERVLSCLVEANRDWAQHAPVLVLGAVSTRFARNDKPNRAAEHDLGLASANLTLEATKRGISVHQMIGILPERAKDVFEIPDGYEVLTGLAIGYHGANPDVDDKFQERDDQQPKGRRPIAEFVFTHTWERSFVTL